MAGFECSKHLENNIPNQSASLSVITAYACFGNLPNRSALKQLELRIRDDGEMQCSLAVNSPHLLPFLLLLFH